MATAITTQQMAAFLNLLHDKKMNPERMAAILSSGVLADVFDPAAILSDRTSVRIALDLELDLAKIFKLTVDYYELFMRVPKKHWIRGTGYQWINPVAANQFRFHHGTGIHHYEAKIFEVDTTKHTTAEVAQLIADADQERPWEPAYIEHLYVLGRKFPGTYAEKICDISALGSVATVDGELAFPKVHLSGGEIGLSYGNWNGLDWVRHRKFLAVRPMKD
jgi:hypothetical protein